MTWCKRSLRSLSIREQESVADPKEGCYEDKGDEDGEAGGSSVLVDGDEGLEFVRDGKKCKVQFLDADVKRPLASARATVDERNIVVFGPQESYIENTNTGQRIPMNRKQGVFVVQLDARAGARSTKTVRFDEPNPDSILRRPA